MCRVSFLIPFSISSLCDFFSPGLVHTEFATRHGVSEEQLKAIFENVKERIPLKRVGVAEEQAQLIVNVASPENSYMTGSVIFNDGGILLG